MMERAQRLYNCITDIGDAYLQEAEQFRPGREKILTLHWKRWSTAAAALVLAVGLGCLAISSLPRMGASETAAPSETTAASAPAASAPDAGAPEATQAPSGSAEDVPWSAPGYGMIFAEHYIYQDYSELARDAQVIVEGTAVTVTPQGEVVEDGHAPLSYTVVEVEVTDVLKGDVEQGDVIQVALLEYVADHPITVQAGDVCVYFLGNPSETGYYQPKSLCRCIVPVDAGLALAESGMLGREEGTVSMDKEEFKNMILQAAEH